MKVLGFIALAVASFLLLSCDKDVNIEGDWDMTENSTVTFTFGKHGGTTTITSVNYNTLAILGIESEHSSNVLSAEIVDENKIKITLKKSTSKNSWRVQVGSTEQSTLAGEIIVNQNVN